MIAQISTASTEYVQVSVSAKESGVAIDPTADAVSMAFLATTAAPASGDWHTASWDTDTATEPDTYLAQCLVGPGAVVLTAAVYEVWVKVVHSPETVVRPAGRMREF